MEIPGRRARCAFLGQMTIGVLKILALAGSKKWAPNFHMPIWLENGPLRVSFCLGPRRCGPHGPIFTPLARTFFARQLVQEENRGHLYHFGNLGVLSSVFIRDLDGITVLLRCAVA